MTSGFQRCVDGVVHRSPLEARQRVELDDRRLRQHQGDSAAGIGRAVDFDRAAVPLHHGAHQQQPQPDTVHLGMALVVQTVKRLEQLRL
ncbi:MAG: hypothetical protein ABUU24_06285 [Variovorax sp.]